MCSAVCSAEIHSAGTTALRSLAQHSQWRVAAVFDNSCYLQSATSWVALVPYSLGDAAINVRVAQGHWSVSGLAAGGLVSVSAKSVSIPGHSQLSLRNTSPWQPVAIAPMQTLDFRRALKSVEQQLARLSRPDVGLASLVIDQLAQARDAQTTLAFKPLRDLQRWLDQPASTAVPQRVQILLGLGPGLTPSGDDVLGAVMISLRSFGRTAKADVLAQFVLPRMNAATVPISTAWLRAAAGGDGARVLHDVILACANPDSVAMARSIDELTRVGHSSGWDTLAGLLAVLRCLSRKD